MYRYLIYFAKKSFAIYFFLTTTQQVVLLLKSRSVMGIKINNTHIECCCVSARYKLHCRRAYIPFLNLVRIYKLYIECLKPISLQRLYIYTYSNGSCANIAINLVIDLEIIKTGNFVFRINGVPTVKLDCFIYLYCIIIIQNTNAAHARAQLRGPSEE